MIQRKSETKKHLDKTQTGWVSKSYDCLVNQND